MKLQLMKCPLCNDNLLPCRHNNGLYSHEYQTACAFVCEELSEVQIEVLRDAALGREGRRELEMKDQSLQNRIDELLDLNNRLFLESEHMKEALKTCLDEFKLRDSGVSPVVMRSSSEMILICETGLKKAEGRWGNDPRHDQSR